MRRGLAIKAVVKYLLTVIVVALLLFVPAGRFDFPNGWLALALLFIPMALFGVVLFIQNPALLARRLSSKEGRQGQKVVSHLMSLLFVAGLVSAGLDARFGWTMVSGWLVFGSSIFFLGGYALFVVVVLQNEYLSRTVVVEEGQRVIEDGLYGTVRHPMYSASIIMFLALPLVLGSLVSLVIFLCYPLLIVVRIGGEEAILDQELEGYEEYKSRVRYRLIPGLW